jgi:hypothetical protein
MKEKQVEVQKAQEKLVIEVEATLQRLQSQRVVWQKHQAQSDTMLYVLLEGCLEFYYFLREKESYESAFKSLCHFKWNTKTKTTMLIAKAVFGDKQKTTNAYARALERAVELKIGKPNEDSMLAWLQSNGGVNGVIRKEASGVSKATLERENRIEVGKNFHRYGIKCKLKFINEDVVKALGSGDSVILVNINSSTNELEVRWSTREDALIDEMYNQLGDSVTKTQAYSKSRTKVAAEMANELAEAQDVVSSELKRIADKVCSSAISQ